jgi:hypothetical protein
MKIAISLAVCCALLASVGASATAVQETAKLVYADFETAKDNRPVSARGGFIQLFAYQESPSSPSRFKGASAGSDAPELVRLSKDDPSRAMTFEYQLQSPNQYAGVGVEVHGQADKDGKPVADDVSTYKFLSLQLYVTGVTSVTMEFVSKGQGIEMNSGYPSATFKVSPGFNTYRVPLDSIRQPSWAEVKVKGKDVLKKLTSVKVIVTCNQCILTKGNVVIDNMVFQN